MLTPWTAGSLRRDEQGAALVAAIAMSLLGALIVVAIIMSANSSGNAARERLHAAANDVLAQDAASVLSDAFSDLESSELDGFLVDRPVLQRHAERLGSGADVLANGSRRIPPELRRVDVSRVPVAGRLTFVQRLDDTRLGYWQLYSMKIPTWGTTPGGRVTAYVRSWATPIDDSSLVTRPMIHRIELRPSWFADFQMLFDGPFRLFTGATVSGRLHSNGYETSLFNQYRASHVQNGVSIDSQPIVCAASARISSASDDIRTTCPASQERSDTGVRYNLLRAREMVDRLRDFCGTPTPGIQLYCTGTTAEVSVQLRPDNRIIVRNLATGATRMLDASTRGDRPGDSQGAVVLTDGNVTLSGSLGSRGRGMVVAASRSDSASYGTGSAPSVWVRSSAPVGSRMTDRSSSFGVVAEGDLVLDHTRACNATFNGAAVTVTGLVSMHPQWRVPFFLPGSTCGTATFNGSMSGHYPPYLNSVNGGYGQRRYAYLNQLFHNPPPLYPTVGDWAVTRLAPADLGCFSTGTLNTAEGAGCT